MLLTYRSGAPILPARSAKRAARAPKWLRNACGHGCARESGGQDGRVRQARRNRCRFVDRSCGVGAGDWAVSISREARARLEGGERVATARGRVDLPRARRRSRHRAAAAGRERHEARLSERIRCIDPSKVAARSAAPAASAASTPQRAGSSDTLELGFAASERNAKLNDRDSKAFDVRQNGGAEPEHKDKQPRERVSFVTDLGGPGGP
jgi:hypothetical protein